MSLTPSGFDLQHKVAELEKMILDKHPKMPTLLREIHTNLSSHPENVTLLKPEEIVQIVNGLKIQTGIEFAAAAIKAPGGAGLKAKIAKLGADAF